MAPEASVSISKPAASFEVLNVLKDTSAMRRVSKTTLIVKNLDPTNPELLVPCGKLGLTRLDCVMVVPEGCFVEAYSDGGRSVAKIHFDTYPSDAEFPIAIMAWGISS